MKNLECIDKLSKAIVEEMIEKGYLDIWDNSYNKDYQIEIDLTVEELRMAAKLAGYKYGKLRNK